MGSIAATTDGCTTPRFPVRGGGGGDFSGAVNLIRLALKGEEHSRSFQSCGHELGHLAGFSRDVDIADLPLILRGLQKLRSRSPCLHPLIRGPKTIEFYHSHI